MINIQQSKKNNKIVIQMVSTLKVSKYIGLTYIMMAKMKYKMSKN